MRKQRRFRGASMVEFALIFPIAFFLITGFFDLGRAVFYYSTLTNAVREATRYAIVNAADLDDAVNNPADNSLQDKVLEYAFGLITSSDPLTKENIIVEPNGDGVIDPFITVFIEATYYFEPITPGIQALLGASEGIELKAHSEMLVTPGSQYVTE